MLGFTFALLGVCSRDGHLECPRVKKVKDEGGGNKQIIKLGFIGPAVLGALLATTLPLPPQYALLMILVTGFGGKALIERVTACVVARLVSALHSHGSNERCDTKPLPHADDEQESEHGK